ncbi:MAG: hypothetical protein MK194_14565 [Roseibacillus sp.]|nr:hypothetical protein [Roseibacillus sp.]
MHARSEKIDGNEGRISDGLTFRVLLLAQHHAESIQTGMTVRRNRSSNYPA